MWQYKRFDSVCCSSKIVLFKGLASGHIWDFCLNHLPAVHQLPSTHLQTDQQSEWECLRVKAFHPNATFSPAAVSNWYQVVMCWNNCNYLTLFLWLTLLQRLESPIIYKSAVQSFIMWLTPRFLVQKSYIHLFNPILPTACITKTPLVSVLSLNVNRINILLLILKHF